MDLLNNYIYVMGVIVLLIIITTRYLIYRRDMTLLCSVSSPKRGTRSERKLVVKMLKQGVHPKAIFHDLYLQKKNGEYSQIDIVVAIPQGLLAIEVKDYSGWLFGNERQKYWTQVLNFGREKYRFYNPLMQNEGHIRTLREQSEQFATLPIYNVVIFDGNCTLKNVSYTSGNTFVGYSSQIKYVLKTLNTFGLAHYTDKKEVACCLHNAVKNGDNREIVARHLASVQRAAR